jgi:N utilization substance protein A
LNGEKIDVVQWNPDLSFFIANSLSPAKVMNVILNDDQGKTAGVVVPDKQLSLAIGKEGQNARLAAKLTGWRIDIKSASEAAEEAIQKAREDVAINERMVDRMSLFERAEAVLAAKPPIEFTDAELNILSEAIEAVSLAQMAIERERKAAALAARKAAQARDILAEAEAILSGKSTVSVDEKEVVAEEAGAITLEEEAEIAAEEAVVAEAEGAPESEEEAELAAEVMDAAEVVLAEQEVEPEPEAEAAEELEVAVEAEIEAEKGAREEVEEKEEEEKALSFEDMLGEEEWQNYDGDDEERERELERRKAREKKRRLVYDERLGEVVAERRRKRSRRTDDWMDYEEY